MCGLFGWTGDFTAAERAAFAWTLGVRMSDRGEDSWGVAHFPTGGSGWRRVREVGSILRVAADIATLPHVMAHTRYATSGAITRENAHPFRRGGIYLSHNGMVYSSSPGAIEGRYTVDSELIADRVAHGRPLTDLEGYGVITWVYRRASSPIVRLCDIEGELSVCEILDDTTGKTPRGVIWASTRSAIQDALVATGVVATRIKVIKRGVIYLATPDGLMRLKGPKLKFAKSGKRFTSWRGSTGATSYKDWSDWGDTDRERDDVGSTTGYVKCIDGVWRDRSVAIANGMYDPDTPGGTKTVLELVEAEKERERQELRQQVTDAETRSAVILAGKVGV